MNATLKGQIHKVTWKEIRDNVMLVNPELTKVIDEISPDDSYPLYKVSYPYGSVIVEEGKFFLPGVDGGLVPGDDRRVDNNIRENLSFDNNRVPAGIILNNSIELILKANKKIMPFRLYKEGDIFALWKKLDPGKSFHPTKIFSITAGARCIFSLPNIGDISLHNNLKKIYNIRQNPPKNLLDQWEIFVKIVKHLQSSCDWKTEILFFPENWLSKILNDPSWNELYLFLLKSAWKSTAYWRNKNILDFAFSFTQQNRNLKPNPYITDTAKHLIAMISGGCPGFTIATDNTVAPIELIQDAYISHYGLKKYAPFLLHPTHFSIETNSAVYYSLQFPTSVEFSPRSRKLANTLYDISELKHIMDIFLEDFLQGHLRIEDTLLHEILKKIELDYFHTKPDIHGEIKLTKDIPIFDKNVKNCLNMFENKIFPESGTFIRGCVGIKITK